MGMAFSALSGLEAGSSRSPFDGCRLLTREASGEDAWRSVSTLMESSILTTVVPDKFSYLHVM